jgi:nucleotide-binding universal stress UspA family protein
VAYGIRELAALAGSAVGDAGVRTAVISSTHPGAAIVKYACDTKIDLILVGTHGRSGFSDFFMGSVAQEVVRTAPCPVLTLRAAG